MRRFILGAVLLAGMAGQGFPQAQGIDKMFDVPKVRKELDLTEQEEKALRDLWETTRREVRVARADRAVKASELKRLMLEPKVNMTEVQKVLREAADLEYKTRLLAVERMVKAREILGDARWARLLALTRGLRGRVMNRKNGVGQDDDGPDGRGPLGRPRRNR